MAHIRGWDIVVVGGANTDYLVRGTNLPAPGETVAGEEFQEAPGGKGANQALAAARLGARVTFIGRVGSDTRGDQIVRQLETERVNVQHVVRDGTVPSGIALIMVDKEGEKQIMTAPGANSWLTVTDIENAAEAIQASRVLLTQLEVPIEAVTRAVELAHESSVKVVLDPAPAVPLADRLLRMVDVIRPNAAEAELLTGVRIQDRSSARQCGQQLLRRGAGAAIVPIGHEGSLVLWGEREDWLPRVPVVSVDSTGAGDAFAAALAVMLAEGRSLLDAASFASAAAALKTTTLGAQAGLPGREAVAALLGPQQDGLGPNE